MHQLAKPLDVERLLALVEHYAKPGVGRSFSPDIGSEIYGVVVVVVVD